MSTERLERIVRYIIEWSVLAAIFLVPIYFAWFHENYTVFDLNKSALLRACVTLMSIAFLFLVSLKGRLPQGASKKLYIAWWALVATSLVSTIFSLHPMISLLGSYERQAGFQNFLAYSILFLFVITFFNTKEKVRQIIIALNCSAAIICSYGLMQVLGLDFLRWSESSMDRIFSSFGQPNFFGHYLVVVLPLAFYAAFYIAKHIFSKIAYYLLAAAELACLLFTYSRSAWLALLITMVLTAIVVLIHYKKKKIAAGLGFILIFAIIFISLAPVRNFILQRVDYSKLAVSDRIVSALDFNGGSTAIRLKYWNAAVHAFKGQPVYRYLFGFGPDVQSSVFAGLYQSDWGYYERLNSFPDRAHNALLDFILQYGFIGLGIFVLFVYRSLHALARKLAAEKASEFWLALALASSLTAYAINNMFSFSLTAMAMLLFVLLALAWIIGEDAPTKPTREITFFQPASRFVIAFAVSILLLILYYGYNVRPLIADHYYMQVKKAEARQDCAAVLENMENVMEWYSISHFYARAYLFHNVNCYSALSTDQSRKQIIANIADQAASIPQKEMQFYSLIDLAHAYSILGYYGDAKYYRLADTFYRRLMEINPVITVAYQDYGRMKLWQGDFVAARELFVRGIEVMPDLSQAVVNSEHTTTLARQLAYFHDLIGLSYYNEKNYTKARPEFERAISIDPKLTSSIKKLADIAYQSGDKKKAIEYNLKGFELEPQNSLWPLGLALIYKEEANMNAARRYVMQGLLLDPQNEQLKALQDSLK